MKLKKELSNVDNFLLESITYGEGIRILNQDLIETILSFIISANNNIPRIKLIIERICEKYGKEIKWNERKYYTFPTLEQLQNVTVEEYRKLGAGFRDKRLYETVQILISKKNEINRWYFESDTSKVREKLLELPGVRTKSCRLYTIIFRFKKI